MQKIRHQYWKKSLIKYSTCNKKVIIFCDIYAYMNYLYNMNLTVRTKFNNFEGNKEESYYNTLELLFLMRKPSKISFQESVTFCSKSFSI